jgi:hypothetical protein
MHKSDNMKRHQTNSMVRDVKRGLNWFDSLVVVTILVMLIALLVPAVVLNSPLRAMHQAFLPRLIAGKAPGQLSPGL